MKIRSVICIFLLCVLFSCSPRSISKHETGAVFTIEGTPSRPGAVAWSPDSSEIALIRDGQLVLLDYAAGRVRKIPEIRPLFIAWAPGDRVAVLSDTGAGKEITLLDAAKGTYSSAPASESAIALKWLYPPDDLVEFSAEAKRYTIGTFITYSFSRVQGEEREIFFQKELYFPTRRQDLDFTSAWSFPEIRPVYETLLMPEYHNPPAVTPYIYFKTVDPVTGIVDDIVKLENRRFNVLASWSPDGSRLAAADHEGLLVIQDADEGAEGAAVSGIPVNYEIKGLNPSWNPRGSQIYLGGWLVGSDGGAVAELLPGAVESIGVWSPDGEKIAVMSESRTLIFDSIHPSFLDPDRPLGNELLQMQEKLRLLKELLTSGLITRSEYDDRRAKLFEQGGEEGK